MLTTAGLNLIPNGRVRLHTHVLSSARNFPTELIPRGLMQVIVRPDSVRSSCDARLLPFHQDFRGTAMAAPAILQQVWYSLFPILSSSHAKATIAGSVNQAREAVMPVLWDMKRCLSIARSLAVCEIDRSSDLPPIFGVADAIS